jgi:hypothetical protein
VNFSHWRKMTWVLLLFVTVIVVLVAINSNGVSCGRLDQVDAQTTGCELQLSRQGGLVFCVGALGFIVLVIGWLMTRPPQPFPRICPKCGLPIKEGRNTCSKCGYAVPVADAASSDGQGPEMVNGPS